MSRKRFAWDYEDGSTSYYHIYSCDHDFVTAIVADETEENTNEVRNIVAALNRMTVSEQKFDAEKLQSVDSVTARETLPLPDGIERDIPYIVCACGGHCSRVPCDEKEVSEYGCWRDTVEQSCCAVAFVCHVCRTRYAGKQPAPESTY